MLSDKVLGRIGDAEITRSIYRELGHMCDKRQVEKEPRDRFGQVKYRLNEHGRIHYFGTIQERWLEFWGVNGFAIVLVLVNLIITLLSILFRK